MKFLSLMTLLFVSSASLFSYPHTQEQTKALQEILDFFEIRDQVQEQTWNLWVQQGKERWEYDARFEEIQPKLFGLFLKRSGLCLPSIQSKENMIICSYMGLFCAVFAIGLHLPATSGIRAIDFAS